jgi:proline iminopeptidase
MIVLALSLALQTASGGAPHEGRIPVDGASLYFREVGKGPPIIVLHGGPDFDMGYFLPDMDALRKSYRLIYYDQRGRGKSADGVRPEDVTLGSDLEDLDAVRRHFRLDAPVLLGHSWGTVLALEYALRHPKAVSRLILMNSAPASTGDFAVMRESYTRALGADLDLQRQIMSTAAYKAGDPETVAARYRIHFKPALAKSTDYEKLMARMKAGFVAQGSEGILKAWEIEDRLMAETWSSEGFDLLPGLRGLAVPTLVIYGDHDFIPGAISQHITRAIPNARLIPLKNCGHFSFMECPDDVRDALTQFFKLARTSTAAPRREPDCSFGAAATCWPLTGRYPAPRREKRDSAPEDILKQPPASLASEE